MTPARRCLAAIALFLAGAAVFAAAYCLAPLYYSNQNQYFLHGLARAEGGPLAEDWLANTKDPTPAFSTLVAVTERWLHPWAFYVIYALLLGAYGASLLGVFVALDGRETAGRRWPVFLALLFLVHSGAARWLSYRVVGFDYPWFLQAGLAGQYVLGGYLQPSTFGVLMVVGISLFAHDRPLLAALATGLSAAMHSTYLLPAALLTLGFLTVLVIERRVRTALAAGAVALAVVLPGVVYLLASFRPTSPEAFAQAQSLLANFRIPHHARVDQWLDWVAALQIAWVVLALALLRGTRLFLALAVPTGLAAVLTVAQVMTGSDTLALLFPWRLSAVLVPVATAVVLARLVALPALPLGGRAAWTTAAVAGTVLVAAGVGISVTRSAYRSGDQDQAVMRFVRDNRAAGQVYFVPVRVPDPRKRSRGSLSSDFMPAAVKKAAVGIIPAEMTHFRLLARAPTFVDFKSIPYLDTEVIEWRERLDEAEAIGEDLDGGRIADALTQLRRRGVTHLLWPAGRELRGDGLAQVYQDEAYRVYRLTANEDGRAGRPSRRGIVE